MVFTEIYSASRIFAVNELFYIDSYGSKSALYSNVLQNWVGRLVYKLMEASTLSHKNNIDKRALLEDNFKFKPI